MIGLFPVAGQDVYLITPPFFEEVAVRSPLTGKTAKIRVVEGFDAGYRRLCIQSVRVNGGVWERSWIGHEFFTEGWVMEIVLGEEESDWGTRVEDRPPSWTVGMESL